MYPPPRNEKVGFQVKVTFWFWLMYPPPRNEKVGFQVKVTFWFWLMNLPPPVKMLDTGQSDILVLADVPPPPQEIEIGLNMKEQKISSREVIKYILPIYPPFHYHYLILCLNKKLVNFNFKWIFGLEPHPPPFSSQKKMKCSFLDYVQLLMIGQADQRT